MARLAEVGARRLDGATTNHQTSVGYRTQCLLILSCWQTAGIETSITARRHRVLFTPCLTVVSTRAAFTDAVRPNYWISTLVDGRGNRVRVTALSDWTVARQGGQGGIAQCVVFETEWGN